MNRSMAMAVWAAAGALALGGCGKVGELEQPAPLYGQKAKADYEARQEAKAQSTQAHKDQDQIERLPPEKPYNSNADPAPSREVPVIGAPRSPNDPPPSGGLPDPMNPPHG